MSETAAHSGTTTPRWHWEDFTPGLTMTFGPRLVEREEIIRFATEFDPQPFHLDDEAAAASLFGRLAASGWHTCAMTMRMMCDAYLLDSSSLGSPGLEKIKWHHPVFPGDSLSGRMRVVESRPMNSRPTVGLLQSHWEVVNQDDILVLSMEGWGMFGRRPG